MTKRWTWVDDYEMTISSIRDHFKRYLDYYESNGFWNVNCEYEWLTETFKDIEPPTGLKTMWMEVQWIVYKNNGKFWVEPIEMVI